MGRAFEFVICVGIVVGAQWLVLNAYEAWWGRGTGGSAPVPESTAQFLTFTVSLGVSWGVLKLWPDDPR